VRAPSSLLNWDEALGAVRELRASTNGEPFVESCKSRAVVSAFNEDSNRIIINSFPETIGNRATKLLAALAKQTDHFGQVHVLEAKLDFPLAYARTSEELKAFVGYLVELGLVVRTSHVTSDQVTLVLTARGHETFAANQLGGGITVFISSTCYDLVDCRAGLSSHLQSLGFRVLLSDQPELFDVPKSGHSIDSCLHNVENSDIVICLIDQRYGQPLDKYGHPGKSATQVEIEHAKKRNKIIRYFIRKQAFAEHSLMRRSPEDFKSSWVEKTDGSQRKRWSNFVDQCKAPPDDGQSNNWLDQFESVVDLKRIVELRIRNLTS